jgi:4'-phosphopantetheinyl transferase
MHAVELRKEKVSLADLQYTKFGRPYFDSLRNFDFNISHSGNMVVCAIIDEGRIGIDIEERTNIDIIDFEEQFSDTEWVHIKDEKFPYYTFYDCWTKKEAVLKADGRGMTLSLHRIDTIGSGKVTIGNDSWFFQKIDAFRNYTCNIACSVLQNNIHLHSVDFKKPTRSI